MNILTKILGKHRKIESINCEASRSCNLRCLQCANHSIYTTPSQRHLLLTPQLFSKLTPILPYTRHINFDNHGEPLLNPFLEDLIQISKSAAPKITTSFTSNFLLMTTDRAEKLLKSGLDIIQVSVPGVTRKTYQRITMTDNFSRFIKCLEDFREVTKNFPHKFQEYSACVTAMKTNLDELSFIPEFIAQFGITRLRINNVLPFSPEIVKESLLEDEETIERTKSIYRETIKTAERFGIKATYALTSAKKNLCRYPIEHFSLSYNGDVCPCWMLDISPGYYCYASRHSYDIPFIKFGNILNGNVFNIWNSPEFVAFRKQFQRGSLPEFCYNCPVGKGMICG